MGSDHFDPELSHFVEDVYQDFLREEEGVDGEAEPDTALAVRLFRCEVLE